MSKLSSVIALMMFITAPLCLLAISPKKLLHYLIRDVVGIQYEINWRVRYVFLLAGILAVTLFTGVTFVDYSLPLLVILCVLVILQKLLVARWILYRSKKDNLRARAIVGFDFLTALTVLAFIILNL